MCESRMVARLLRYVTATVLVINGLLNIVKYYMLLPGNESPVIKYGMMSTNFSMIMTGNDIMLSED